MAVQHQSATITDKPVAYETILVEAVEGGVGVITLNRPEVLNALSSKLVRELDEALFALDEDPAIGCIVVTGAGEKAFSSGADIHEAVAKGGEGGNLTTHSWDRANLKTPTIGALNGLVYGGGTMIACDLDIRIGCERTRFRFLQASLGRLGPTWSLPLIVGWPRAKELLFTARVVQPEEALQMGLLNKLVPADRVLEEAIAMGRQIAANKPGAVRAIKQLLSEHVGRGWHEMLLAERSARVEKVEPPPPPTEAFKDFLDRKRRTHGG
ncbi:MAG TPA: enoyl-CoA hydratase/isomerase family protein [Chloroflexota bacterium]|nr:enoyl-CoA hydratase/isomerase family protein [Chloroflexota bacterium]